MNWLPLKLVPPPVNTEVLICDGKTVGIALLNERDEWHEVLNWTFVSGDWGHYSCDTDVDTIVTHWATLPTPPKD